MSHSELEQVDQAIVGDHPSAPASPSKKVPPPLDTSNITLSSSSSSPSPSTPVRSPFARQIGRRTPNATKKLTPDRTLQFQQPHVSPPLTPATTVATTPSSVFSNSTSSLNHPTTTTTSSSSSPPTRWEDSSFTNPIQSDGQLKALVDQLLLGVDTTTDNHQNHNTIDSYRAFQRWKAHFLTLFQDFLDKPGHQPAQCAFEQFQKTLTSFTNHVQHVQKHLQQGNLSDDRITVKGRKSLNELQAGLTLVIGELRHLIPSSSTEETTRGYTKFHLGAHLLEHGFESTYTQLREGCERLEAFQEHAVLQRIANAQQFEEMVHFQEQTGRFLDILEDMGLLKVLCRGWELSQCSSAEEFVFVDLKTGAVGAISAQACVDAGLVHGIIQTEDNDDDDDDATENINESMEESSSRPPKLNFVSYTEALTNEEDRKIVLDMVRDTLKITE